MKASTTGAFTKSYHSTEELSNHRRTILSRKEQVDTLRDFGLYARREVAGLPDKLRLAIEAIAASQRIDDHRKIEKLQERVIELGEGFERLEREKLALETEVTRLKAGMKSALCTLEERDKTIARLRIGQEEREARDREELNRRKSFEEDLGRRFSLEGMKLVRSGARTSLE